MMVVIGAMFMIVGASWITIEPRLVKTDQHILGRYFGIRTGPRYAVFRRCLSVIGGSALVVTGVVLIFRAIV